LDVFVGFGLRGRNYCFVHFIFIQHDSIHRNNTFSSSINCQHHNGPLHLFLLAMPQVDSLAVKAHNGNGKNFSQKWAAKQGLNRAGSLKSPLLLDL
jgi:hypothetical protein